MEEYSYSIHFPWSSIEVDPVFQELFKELKDILKYVDETNIKNNFWHLISEHIQLQEEFIEKYSKYIYWQQISKYQKLSETFIKKHYDKVDLYNIYEYQNLSESFILENYESVHWQNLSMNKCISSFSKEFIQSFVYIIHWDRVIQIEFLSETFIDEHQDHFTLIDLLKYQKLSEEFIKKLNITDTLLKRYWDLIAIYQDISLDFIKENIIFIDEKLLYKNKNFKKSTKTKIGKIYKIYKDLT